MASLTTVFPGRRLEMQKALEVSSALRPSSIYQDDLRFGYEIEASHLIANVDKDRRSFEAIVF